MTLETNKRNAVARKQDVINFIENTEFKGYQAIDLPYGLKTPGMDRSKTANVIFKRSIEGKSILDIGCKYGYFCHEAFARGASLVKGIEISDENSKIANEIIKLWGRDIDIINEDFSNVGSMQKFDIILLLNVLHHVNSPTAVMQKISEHTKELAIVEFPSVLDSQTGLSKFKKILYRYFFNKDSLIYLGEEKYHRTWYFSKKAFENLVINQLSLFKNVEFIPSPRKYGRYIAYCWKA